MARSPSTTAASPRIISSPTATRSRPVSIRHGLRHRIVPSGRRHRRSRATRYVAEAKRQVAGVVGVASAFAGPSEIVVVAGPEHPPVRRHRPRGAGRARARRAGLVGDLGRRAGRRGLPRSTALSRSRRRRADLEIDPRHVAGSPVSSTAPSRHWRWPTWSPPSTSTDGPDEPGQTCSIPSRTPAPSSSGPGRRPASATTSPGPTTCCPPTGRRASPSALRADDFRTHIHAVTVSPTRSRSRPARRDPGRDRRAVRPRRVGPYGCARPRSGDGDEPTAGEAPSLRCAPTWPHRGVPLAPGRRGRAPQHERVALRPLRDRGATRSAARWRRCRSTAIPTAPATELAPRWPPARRHPRGVFCANGSNEVLQMLAAGLRRTGSPVAASSSRPTPCTRTSPGSPAPRWSPGAGPTTS